MKKRDLLHIIIITIILSGDYSFVYNNKFFFNLKENERKVRFSNKNTKHFLINASLKNKTLRL